MIVPNIKIGLLHSGKLINEITVDELKDVTIGRSLNNTIIVDAPNFYDTFPLLIYSEGKYYLNVYRGASGKILEGKNVLSLKDVGDHPDVIQRGEVLTLPLSNDVRGILLIGKETVLFKVYPSRSVPNKLPREFRGKFFGKDFDYTFYGILTVFILSYILLVYSFSKVQMKEDIRFEHIPDRFARLIMDTPDSLKSSKEKLKELAKKEEKIAFKQRQTKGSRKGVARAKGKGGKNLPVPTARPGGGNEQKPKNASEIVRSSGIIGIIGSKGQGGSVANLFHNNDFNEKLNKALKGVGGLHAATSIAESKMKRGSGDAQAIDVGSLKAVTGSGVVAFGSSNASAFSILGGIGEGDMEGEGTMSPSIIAKILAQHVGAFQYCYNKSLQTNPKLSGELKVRFTIMTNGLVDRKKLSYSGPASRDANLTLCIGRVFGTISFPEPKGGEVIVNYPLNFMAQN